MYNVINLFFSVDQIWLPGVTAMTLSTFKQKQFTQIFYTFTYKFDFLILDTIPFLVYV